jgi:hypothetical protein
VLVRLDHVARVIVNANQERRDYAHKDSETL